MNAAIIHAHMAVISPCRGVPPLATARDIDKGIAIRLTVMPDFIFGCIVFHEGKGMGSAINKKFRSLVRIHHTPMLHDFYRKIFIYFVLICLF